VNREFFIITYRTDPEALSAVIPAPREMTDPIVKFEFIRMPDSTGFGDYTESGQVIPVSFRGQKSGYVQSMYLNDHALIAAGRGALGFPKKLAHPELRVEKDTLGGVLQHGPVPVAVATMGYKKRTLDHGSILESLLAPSFRLKIIPHADGTPRISRMHWSELYHPATSPARPARLLCGPDAASEGLQCARPRGGMLSRDPGAGLAGPREWPRVKPAGGAMIGAACNYHSKAIRCSKPGI
jgi:acetoacetate decarboxylase